MAVILPELIDEILVCLPAKSIIRFESVCKEWQSKFHSISFKESYWQRSKNKNESKSKMMKLKDLFKMAPELQHSTKHINGIYRTKISVMGPSSNGIYCLTSILFNKYRVVELWCCKIALCNPGIGQSRFLPHFPARFHYDLNRVSYGSNSNCVVSGFDGSSCCFRVVIVISYGVHCFLVFVYSSNSDKWEKLVDYNAAWAYEGAPSATRAFARIRHIVCPTEACSQKFLNGCWHWMVQLQEDKSSAILSYNFTHQLFSLINGPPIDFVAANGLVDVFVLHDHLAVIRRSWVDGVSIWMMMDYGAERSWTLKFRTSSEHGLNLSSALYSVEEEGGCDGVCIKRLLFLRSKHRCKNEIISLDHHGECEVTTLQYNPNRDIIFSTGGISGYKETLLRLY